MTRHFFGDSGHNGIGFVDQHSTLCTDCSRSNRSFDFTVGQTQLSAGAYEISTRAHVAFGNFS